MTTKTGQHGTFRFEGMILGFEQAAVTLLAGLLVGALGCDSGASTTGGDSGTQDGASASGSGKVIPGIPASPLPGGGNPCGQAPGCTLDSCGWNQADGRCYQTHWCVPSVPTPFYGTPTTADDDKTPANAICAPDGGGTYLFSMGTIMMWYGDPSTPTSGAGHVCAPNVYPLYVECANP